MADVFVSYARQDLPFVRRLTAALQARGRTVWVDLEGITPSARWLAEIRTAITEADTVVVITPDSVTSEICRIELDCAVEASKRLDPILARETPVEGVPSALAELNWLSFLDGTDLEAGVDRLVEILDTDLDRVHLHTRLLTQARAWETRDHPPVCEGTKTLFKINNWGLRWDGPLSPGAGLVFRGGSRPPWEVSGFDRRKWAVAVQKRTPTAHFRRSKGANRILVQALPAPDSADAEVRHLDALVGREALNRGC